MNELTDAIVAAIADKKAKNIVSLDLSGFDGAICSAFIICNADSTTQVAAIADAVQERTERTLGEKARRIEGLGNALWVVMDYSDILVHIFLTELRDFYRLEDFWADAPVTRYGSEE